MGSDEAASARERKVMDTFVELADTLASDYDLGEFLHLLVDRCAEILGADTAGVLLETERGDLRLAAAVSEEMDAIERLEVDKDQGPCIEAYRRREPVIAQDLDRDRERWPDVAPRLVDMGMRSGYAFPLKLRQDCIGALSLYRRSAAEFHEDDVRLAQAFADVAAIGILQRRTVAAAEERSRQLQHALNSRIIIEQAKGVLAERHGVTTDKAFEALRGYARRNGLKVRDVSRQIVDGHDPEITFHP
jgi:GAF domain-containing protein